MEEIEFTPWPKIARLNRDIVVTEKIDGTNAAVGITDSGTVYAQSRNRILTKEKGAGNFGFKAWVEENSAVLLELLGPGVHFGEWWGLGIQRNYGMDTKVFSLFNTARWAGIDEQNDIGVRAVPVLYQGIFDQAAIEWARVSLEIHGSVAAPGFKDPEGVVVFHTAANQMFKVTIKDDEKPKGSNETTY